MKRILFALTAISIVVAILVSVLAIWDYIDSDIAFRTIATIAVVLVGGMAFSAAYEQLINKTPGVGDASAWRNRQDD